ncbi:ATP-binding protein [Planctomycetota bacterium]
MIESLRAFGYTLPAAIADLIDNSISARARRVWLNFVWDGSNSYLSIADDGCGMTQNQLIDAMRPGSQNPLDERDASDLGRFGLGLKTASFSQCRRLTVQSQREGGRKSTRCWDLDYVRDTGQWRLLSHINPDTSERIAGSNSHAKGTVVLWESLDRLVADADTDDGNAQQRFLDLIDEVETHLSMVFHRFMSGSRPLRIYINGTEKHNVVRPWNPFLEDHSATQCLQSERLRFKGTTIRISAFVLPHHDKLDKAQFEAAAGPGGWNAHQGFYVYRNKRLLVPGDWLGFRFAKEEHYKLARVQIDIPNSIDGDWSIDVRKSHARPPAAIRKDLKRIADLTRKRAVEVYRHRGKTLARKSSQPHVFAWKPVKRGQKNFYAINRQHPMVKWTMSVSKEYRPAISSFLWGFDGSASNRS